MICTCRRFGRIRWCFFTTVAVRHGAGVVQEVEGKAVRGDVVYDSAQTVTMGTIAAVEVTFAGTKEYDGMWEGRKIGSTKI